MILDLMEICKNLSKTKKSLMSHFSLAQIAPHFSSP